INPCTPWECPRLVWLCVDEVLRRRIFSSASPSRWKLWQTLNERCAVYVAAGVLAAQVPHLVGELLWRWPTAHVSLRQIAAAALDGRTDSGPIPEKGLNNCDSWFTRHSRD